MGVRKARISRKLRKNRWKKTGRIAGGNASEFDEQLKGINISRSTKRGGSVAWALLVLGESEKAAARRGNRADELVGKRKKRGERGSRYMLTGIGK